MSEKKSIIKNYIYNLIYQITVIILPLITTPYLTRVLGAESLGIYGYTLSIATYFVLFGSLGVAMYGKREIAYHQDNKSVRSKIFFEVLLMRFITLGMSLLLFYFCFCSKGEYKVYYRILVLELISASLDISWLLQGLEEFKKTAIRSTFIKILSVILIFLLVKTKKDLIVYFFIYVLSNVIGNLSLWLYLPKYIQKIKFKELNLFRHFKPTIALFIPQIAVQVYTILDKTMIGNILGDMAQVGNYEQSQKILRIAVTVVSSSGLVISSRISSVMANNQTEEVNKYLTGSFSFVWFLATPIMFGIMAVAKNMVPWFLGEEFRQSILILMCGAPIILILGLNNVSGEQYLVATKQQNLFTKSVICGATINVILNFILIPKFKAVGAIISSVLSEFIVLVVQLIDIRKKISLKIVYKNSFKYIISGIIMFFITYGIGLLLEPKVLTTIIQIVIGTVTYGLLLIIFRDKILFETLNRIKMKFFGGNNE